MALLRGSELHRGSARRLKAPGNAVMEGLDKSGSGPWLMFSWRASEGRHVNSGAWRRRYLGDQWNRLMDGLTNMGLNSAMGLGQLGMGAGNSITKPAGAGRHGNARPAPAGAQQGANMVWATSATVPEIAWAVALSAPCSSSTLRVSDALFIPAWGTKPVLARLGIRRGDSPADVRKVAPRPSCTATTQRRTGGLGGIALNPELRDRSKWNSADLLRCWATSTKPR